MQKNHKGMQISIPALYVNKQDRVCQNMFFLYDSMRQDLKQSRPFPGPKTQKSLKIGSS